MAATITTMGDVNLHSSINFEGPLHEQLLPLANPAEIDSSSLSSNSSSASYASFKDLKDAWEIKSTSSTGCDLSARHDANNDLRLTRRGPSESAAIPAEHSPGKYRRNDNQGANHSSYASQLYHRGAESPYDTTTASTTRDGSCSRNGSARSGRRGRRRRESSRSSNKNRPQRGELARQFDQDQSDILTRFQAGEAARPVGGGEQIRTPQHEQLLQDQHLSQARLHSLTVEGEASIEVELNEHQPRHLNNISKLQNESRICLLNEQRTNDALNSARRIGSLITEDDDDDEHEQFMSAGAIDDSSQSRQLQQQEQLATSSQDQHQLLVNPTTIAKGKSVKTPPPELNAFLSSPTGLNWEDLVRSLKQNRDCETLLNKTIAFNADEDDDVSVLEEGIIDEGSGKDEQGKFVGDLEYMGNVVTAYLKTKDPQPVLRNRNESSQSMQSQMQQEQQRRHGQQEHCSTWNDGELSLGGSDEHDANDKENDDDLSSVSNVSGISFKPTSGSDDDDLYEGDDADHVVGEEETIEPSPPRGPYIRGASLRANSLGDDADHVVGEEETIEPSPPRGPYIRGASLRANSLPRDSLEKKIEMVVTEQQPQQQQAKKNATKPIPPLNPPPRSKSFSPQTKWNKKVWARQRLGSGVGSAFSPIKSPPSTMIHSPTTSGTALESTFESSFDISEEEGLVSPPSVRSFSSRASSTPVNRDELVFSPIEPQSNSSEQPIHEPISPEARRSPKRGSSYLGNSTFGSHRSGDVNVAPRIASAGSGAAPTLSAVAKRRAQRAARQRRCESDPSDPPIFLLSILDDTFDSDVNDTQPLLDSIDNDLGTPGHREALVVDPPLMPISSDELDDDDDSFYHHIRGTNSLDILDTALDVSTEVVNGKEVEGVAPFPTCWDDDEFAEIDITPKDRLLPAGSEQMTDNDNNKNNSLKKAVKNSLSTATTAASTIKLSLMDISKSFSGDSWQVEEEDEDEVVDSGPVIILPETLSVNRKNPTCWQITRHAVRRTKGEF